MKPNHKPCPRCGDEMHRQSKLCWKCHNETTWTEERRRETGERFAEVGRNAVWTDERKARLSAKLKLRKMPKGWKHSEETKRKMRRAWTPEMRKAARKRGRKQAANAEWRLKIAEKLSGDKNPMWKGGMSQSKYKPGFSRRLKRRIRKRDGYRCQLCGISERRLGYRLSIHHADYDKTNHHKSNLFSTCKGCNSRVNVNREVWLSYFTVLAEARKFGHDVSQFIGRKVITQHKGYAIVTRRGGPDLSGTIIENVLASLAS